MTEQQIQEMMKDELLMEIIDCGWNLKDLLENSCFLLGSG